MRCPECDYALWSLKAGPCPECGRPFKPSEFEFLANAVRFCCPHCDQGYYGTSERGQLVPERFDCVSCGKAISTDEMVLRPAEALGDRDAHLGTNPWLDKRRGILKRYVLAMFSGIGQPGRMMEVTPAFGSTGAAVGLAILNIMVASSLSVGMFVLLTGFSGGAMLGPAGMSIFVIVVTPLVSMFIWTAVTHGMLHLLRAKPSDTMGRTLQAIGFSSGAYVLAIVPCIGTPMGFVAWTITATIAVRAGQRVGSWKATIATMAFPAAVAVSVVAWYLWITISSINSMAQYNQQQPPTWSQPVTQQNWAPGTDIRLGTQGVADVLRQQILQGNPPRHAAELLGDSRTDSMAFMEHPSAQPPVVGGFRLWDLNRLDPVTRRNAIDVAVAAWPPDITAHRVGRILLTYHGITPTSPTDLWIMVQLPAEPGEDFWAITMNSYERFDRGNPQPALDGQNRKRAAAGLPPLPDMATILGNPGPWSAGDGTPPP